ncbi:hypothetical protein HBB16_03385 [Pseudonocardia sp. MCCB 268]|nr:hypothetical protein [Pseudonocardia cytotoxica]
MEFLQFHPTGMVCRRRCGGSWWTGVGPRWREAAQPDGERVHVSPTSRRVPPLYATPRGGRPLVHRPDNNWRLSCCPATRSPARSTRGVKAGRGARTAACSSTSPPGSSRRRSKRLPSMHHQFMSWPTSIITAEPMRSGRPATT